MDGQANRVPVEEVARFPPPGMSTPVAFSFSPDDRLLTYLYGPDQSPVRQLHALDVLSGESRVIQASVEGDTTDLSLEEQLLRQRQRQLGEGIVRYSWSRKGQTILIPAQSGVYVKDGADSPARLVVSSKEGAILDPQLSPDGTLLAFVRDAEICVVPTSAGCSAGGGPTEGGETQVGIRELTHGARGTGKTHGLAEYIAQEEMGWLSGFWWSRDGRCIAFEEVDESHIPEYRIVHQGKETTGEGAQENHRYPFAGEPNARVRLGVVSVDGGDPVWLDLGDDDDFYLARVDWMPDGSLCAQIENREQTRLDLVRFDVTIGDRTVLLSETSDVWINLHDAFLPLDNGDFVWASEHSGFCHLYLCSRDGEVIRQLTAGLWVVGGLSGVDQKSRRVYFTGTRDGVTERHLYCVSLEGGSVERITTEPGTHLVTIDHALRRFVDVFSDIRTPPTITLRSIEDGSTIHTIHEPDDPRIEALVLEPPELIEIESRDGETLHGALYRPQADFGPGRYPTIIYVYGGPHVQVVANHWSMTAAMRIQFLRSQGYLVFSLDNRGSARRGLAFEGVIKHNMGDIEVRDQVDGVRWLVDSGLADPERVGVYGWSYGGYMTLMCLSRAPDVFKMGVAGAPVTHWDGYDTHYTERYMGTPESNPDGYRDSSVMAHVENLRGDLLIVHGMIDENVHFRHTARLLNALIKARKRYELLLFPDERHMPRSLTDRVYMEERIAEFFRRNL